jgi:hypothetical protein
MLLREGIHQISADAYFADPCPEPSLSSHVAATLLMHSPLHAWLQHPRLNPKFHREEDSRLDFGSTAHDVLLEGGTPRIATFDPSQYPNAKGGGVATGWTNKAIREARDAARAQGKIPVLLGDWNIVQQMVGVAKEFIAKSELAGCLSWPAEQTIIWSEDDAWFRARPDLWTTGCMVDYKTTTDANPEYLIRRVMGQMGYDIQAAFYRRADRAESERSGRPTGDANFVFLFQEIDPPFACSLIGLEPTFIDTGDLKVEAAMGIWRGCMKAGQWPAYGPQIHYAQAPAWMLADAERY